MVAVPPPTDPPVLAPARNEGALGLGYYIPPELRQFGRNLMSFARAVDPVQGIMRGMRATGRAFDSELPSEERKAAAVEAALETLAPVGMIGMGALAKQPIKATLMDVLTPTGAPASMTDEAVEAVSDPSRRAFMKGAAATGGIAALAPDLAMEAMNKVPAAVTKTAARVAANPVNMAAAAIKNLRKQREEALGNVYNQTADAPLKDVVKAQEFAEDAKYLITDEAAAAIRNLDPSDYRGADNDSLEDIASVYFIEDIGINAVDEPEFFAKFEPLVKEIERRGLHTAKDIYEVDKFPFARSIYEDFLQGQMDVLRDNVPYSAIGNQIIPKTSLKMTDDDSGKSTEQLIKELGERAFKSQYDFVKRQLEMETDLSPEEIDRIARINASRKGRNMAEGGVVSFAPYLR